MTDKITLTVSVRFKEMTLSEIFKYDFIIQLIDGYNQPNKYLVSLLPKNYSIDYYLTFCIKSECTDTFKLKPGYYLAKSYYVDSLVPINLEKNTLYLPVKRDKYNGSPEILDKLILYSDNNSNAIGLTSSELIAAMCGDLSYEVMTHAYKIYQKLTQSSLKTFIYHLSEKAKQEVDNCKINLKLLLTRLITANLTVSDKFNWEEVTSPHMTEDEHPYNEQHFILYRFYKQLGLYPLMDNTAGKFVNGFCFGIYSLEEVLENHLSENAVLLPPIDYEYLAETRIIYISGEKSITKQNTLCFIKKEDEKYIIYEHLAKNFNEVRLFTSQVYLLKFFLFKETERLLYLQMYRIEEKLGTILDSYGELQLQIDTDLGVAGIRYSLVDNTIYLCISDFAKLHICSPGRKSFMKECLSSDKVTLSELYDIYKDCEDYEVDNRRYHLRNLFLYILSYLDGCILNNNYSVHRDSLLQLEPDLELDAFPLPYWFPIES